MKTRTRQAVVGGIILAYVLIGCPDERSAVADEVVRFMTYNAHMSGFTPPYDLAYMLSTPDRPAFRNLAHVVQTLRPDVLALDEFDFDESGTAAALFQANYLSVSQSTPYTGTTEPIEYPYVYLAPSNTGISAGHDFDNNGVIVTTPGSAGYGDDCFGFGDYEGEYGMLLLSQYPILDDQVRTFQLFKWKDLPNADRPPWPGEPDPYWYSDAEWDDFRLSSKSHWDVPIAVAGHVVHVLMCHPTPPVFDEDAPDETDYNGRRNFEEIRFWVAYVDGLSVADDLGLSAALPGNAEFVVLGDMNADPDSDGRPGASEQLTEHPRIIDPAPVGLGGDVTYGGWRLDYALPAAHMTVLGGGVLNDFVDLSSPWMYVYPRPSDHYPVWVDVLLRDPHIEADLNADCAVGDDDLAILLGAWGTDDPIADINGDRTVDNEDLGLLLSAWGNECGTGAP
ncbi:MAG: endonuclease/exonuclease/phosphatase family protein [Phycisphaerae bacterium]|jgi:endonuclease/exonuclease/phosphatase family metal-dependent hydrolase